MGPLSSPVATLQKRDFASSCDHQMPTADQQEVLEGTATGVEEVVLVLSPSSCVTIVLTWGKFAMGSAHGGTRLEVVVVKDEDTLIQRAVDLILYPVRSTHGVPNQLLDRLPDHYHLAPEGTHEESGEYR